MKRAPTIFLWSKPTPVLWSFRAFHETRHWVTTLCKIGVFLIGFGSHSLALANQEFISTPWSLLVEHRAKILTLASDEEAFSFFHGIHTPQGRNSRTRTQSQSSPTTPNLSEPIQQTIIAYMASLAATAHTQALRKLTVESTMTGSLSTEPVVPEAGQLQWLTDRTHVQTLKSVFDSYIKLSALSQTGTHPISSDNDYADFAAYHDVTYPLWADSPSSWTHIFEEQGIKEVEARLLEYWHVSGHQSNESLSSKDTHQAYAQRYIKTRLLPLFRTGLLNQVIRLEALTYERAMENWNHIQQWQEGERTRLAALRLCGTWRWIVHNHQNHGDHKMTITFPPPNRSSPSQPEPTTISIQGDTVYLKWTFPQGVQEDSLLLSNHDSLLEGTFKNSFGPHGSISGKRLSPCPS